MSQEKTLVGREELSCPLLLPGWVSGLQYELTLHLWGPLGGRRCGVLGSLRQESSGQKMAFCEVIGMFMT